jgi:hypothetical protein
LLHAVPAVTTSQLTMGACPSAYRSRRQSSAIAVSPRRPSSNADLLFGRVVLPGCPPDCGQASRTTPGWSWISVSSSLLEGYDEPEILRSSSRQFCLIRVIGGAALDRRFTLNRDPRSTHSREIGGGEMPNCIVCDARNAKRQPGAGDFARFDCPRCGSFVLSGTAEAVLERRL